MNIITKIALSLSLIASVTQQTQTASYANHAKKAGKIAWHAGQTVAGSMFLAYYLSNALQDLKQLRSLYGNKYIAHNKRNKMAKEVVVCMAQNSALLITTFPTLFYYGIKGLKKEICPNFDAIAWMKNKLSKKTQQPA